MGDLVVIEQNPLLTQKHAGGRPTLYTQKLGKAICDRIAEGMTKRGACGLYGVNEETFRLWQDTREEFIQMLARAEAQAEKHFTDVLVKAAAGTHGLADYRAGVEWLKRRRRADYGDTLDVRSIPKETVLEILRAQMQAEAIPEADTPLIESAEDVL